jgi:hypothetical protein
MGYLIIAETTKVMKGRLSKVKHVIEQQGFDIYNEEEIIREFSRC